MTEPPRTRIWNPADEVAGFVEAYRAWMLARYRDDVVPHPPHIEHGVLHNIRPWEHFIVMRHAAFDPEHAVLDTGALHTYFCLYVCDRVKRMVVTDNFYWAQREYNQREGLWDPETWCRFVEGKYPGRLSAEKADLTDLQYDDQSFDRVLCVSTIEHVSDDAKAMAEMHRVLRPGGRLLLTTEFSTVQPRPYTERDGSYMRVYAAAELLALCAAPGFQIAVGPIAERRTWPLVRRKSNIFLALDRPA